MKETMKEENNVFPYFTINEKFILYFTLITII